MPAADPAVYEYFFWSMLAVVATAIVGGALLGRFARVAATLAACAALALIVALIVYSLLSRAPILDGQLLLTVASFMFTFVIAAAFSLLVRRVRMRGSPH